MDLRYHEPKTHGGKRVFFQNALRRAIGPRMEMKPLTYDAIQEKMYMEVSYIRTHTHTRCNTLQHTATYCLSNVLTKLLTYDPTQEKMYMEVLYTRTHAHTCCNTLQHTATHCNTLQHTALAMYSQIRSIMMLLKRRKFWRYCTYAHTHIHIHTQKLWRYAQGRGREKVEVGSGVREGESGFIYTHTHTHSHTYDSI